ncbi:MAG TPA: sigma-70 family RNA polymerase sigma factor [Acidimicrobiales bacterium]
MHPTPHSAIPPRPTTDDRPSDQVLLRRFGGGDEAAGRAFVRRYQGRVYGLARTLVGDPVLAEEIAQEALIRVWRNGLSFDARRGSVSTWVLTITRNLAIDVLRKKRAEPCAPNSELLLNQLAQEPTPDEAASITDEAARVRTALVRVPNEQRRALVLAAFYQYTAREISAAESIPLGTAKSRVRSGLIKMRSLIEEGNTSFEHRRFANFRPTTAVLTPDTNEINH